MKQVNKHPLLTKEQEKELGTRVLTKNKEAIDKLIVSNLRFVVQIANKYRNYTKTGKFSILDIIQEGNDGLIYAANKYDIRKGYRFTTYAVWWIKARIMQFIIKSHSMVKIGTTSAERQLFFKIGYIKHLLEIFDHEERKEARKQLSDMIGLPIKKIQQMENRVAWDDVSFDAKQTGREQQLFTLHDVVAYPQQLEETITAKNNKEKARSAINKIMKNLSDREQDILERRWLQDEGETLQKIANVHGISRERVRQIETNIFNKIRRQLLNSNSGKEAVEAMLK